MKTTLKLHFYDKSEKDIKKLNELLNPYGVTFTPDQEQHQRADGTNITQKLLHIDVNEAILNSHTNTTSKAGRPPKKIDYDKVVDMKRNEFDVNTICKALNISRALYYREILSSIDKLEVGSRVEYHPLDADTWITGTVQKDNRGTKYIQCDDGVEDYPRSSDVIRKIV